MFRKIIRYSVIFVILVGLGSAWYYRQHTASPLLHAVSSAPRQPWVPVHVASVIRMPAPQYLETVGTLQAKQVSNISSDLADKVVAILYQPGSYVTKGTSLIQLDDRSYRATLQSDQAAYALAKMNFGRYEELAKVGAQAEQALDQARANYLQAQAKVSVDETLLSETTITAPFDGYVGAKTVSVGDYVQPGQTLTVVVDRKLLQVDYSFPEKYLPEIKLGQTVTLRVSNLAHEKKHPYRGEVTYIAPQVDPSTHSINLQADIPNPQNELTPGLFVKVREDLGINQNTLVVPEESVLPTITGSEIYVVRKGKAYAVPVTTGKTFGDKMQILFGLHQGDTVITVGQQQVKDGTLVKEVHSP